MPLHRVHIRKEALLEILREAIHHYRKECYGSVFGKRPSANDPYYTISYASPQARVKTRTMLEVDPSHYGRKLDRLFESYPTLYPIIGRFHSHTSYRGNKPSALPGPGDLPAMIQDGLPLEIIVAIQDYNGGYAKHWQHSKDGSLKGSLGNYYFEIAVYILDPDSEKPREIQLKFSAPSAVKALNRAIGS